MWTFLTGASAGVRQAMQQGHGADLGGDRSDPPPAEISPGTLFVLVDGASRIRGFYDPKDPGAVDRAIRDAALLVNRR
jgi:hypothetical protein